MVGNAYDMQMRNRNTNARIALGIGAGLFFLAWRLDETNPIIRVRLQRPTYF